MYLPEHFQESNQDVLIDLIQKHALGCLVTYIDGELSADHLPFIYDQSEHCLFAHIAKKNPLYTQLINGMEGLIVFQIDHAYVSPNWYVGKFEHHRAVPTWNYVVIHVKGEIKLIEDEKSLRGILAKLTRQHESSQPKPWKMSDAPKEYIADQLNHIVGIQVNIRSLIGKFKLSQNREKMDIENVAKAFEDLNKKDLATMMLDP